MKDFTKYAMGIVTGISVAVALGAAGNGGQQDEPRSSSRAKRPAVERLGDQSCLVIEGAWGAPRLLENSCEDFSLPDDGAARYVPRTSAFAPWAGRSLGVYGRSIASLNEATGKFAFETPLYAIDESLVIPFFDPPCTYPGGNVIMVGWEGSVLFDVDGDGIRDFVAYFIWEDPYGYPCVTPVLWFKNLAFPLPGEDSSEPRLLGDLNGDCEVSGADLGLLLNAYGNVCP